MKKRLTIIGSCIILIVISVIGVMAAYTSRSFVKGVATTPKQGLALSSDYLGIVAQSATEDKYGVRKIVLDEKNEDDNTPYTFSFYIQNSSDGVVNEKSMKYTLLISDLPEGAKVLRSNAIAGDEDITASVGDGFQAPLMPAYTKVTHNYTISIPKNSVKDSKDILIKAIPDTDSDSSGNMLATKVQLSIVGVVAGFSYNGFFLDKTQENAPHEFVAFNYEVEVSNASEAHTMVLTWDTQYVEIDPLFLQQIEGTITSKTDGRLEFSMDAVHSSYLVKFYRLDGRNEDDLWQKNWEELEKVITFTESNELEFLEIIL